MTRAGIPPPPKRRRLGFVEEELPPYPSNIEMPLVVFANGSTLPNDSDWVLRWKRMVGDALNAIEVIVFDYPEISAKELKGASKSRIKVLFDYHWGCLEDAILKHPGHPLILMGASFGSRLNCMIAWYDYFNITAVVCLGYQLKAKNGRLCIGPIDEYVKPTIFIQGTEDPFCPMDNFRYSWGVSSICNRLHKIKGGDQFLQVRKEVLEQNGTTQEEVEREAVKEIANYVSNMIGEVWKHEFDKPVYRKIAFGLRSTKVDKWPPPKEEDTDGED